MDSRDVTLIRSVFYITLAPLFHSLSPYCCANQPSAQLPEPMLAASKLAHAPAAAGLAKLHLPDSFMLSSSSSGVRCSSLANRLIRLIRVSLLLVLLLLFLLFLLLLQHKAKAFLLVFCNYMNRNHSGRSWHGMLLN